MRFEDIEPGMVLANNLGTHVKVIRKDEDTFSVHWPDGDRQDLRAASAETLELVGYAKAERPVDPSPRAALLDEAKALIMGDRNNTYGPPTQDFKRAADALAAYGYLGPDGRRLQPHDVSFILICLKLSRLVWTPAKRDSWADVAGYAGCGYECAITEGEQG